MDNYFAANYLDPIARVWSGIEVAAPPKLAKKEVTKKKKDLLVIKAKKISDSRHIAVRES